MNCLASPNILDYLEDDGDDIDLIAYEEAEKDHVEEKKRRINISVLAKNSAFSEKIEKLREDWLANAATPGHDPVERRTGRTVRRGVPVWRASYQVVDRPPRDARTARRQRVAGL